MPLPAAAPRRHLPLVLAGAALLLLAAAALLLLARGSARARPLRVGMLVWPAYEMAFLARDLGYYEGAGIELLDYESPADALRAYQNGSIDAVAFTVDYALKALERDPSHRIVLAINLSEGGDAMVARGDVKSLADLRGRRVGIESSVLGAYLLTRALEKAGLRHDEVEVVSVDVPDQEEAFVAQSVDAVITYEPTRSRLLAQGGTQLFSSADISGEIVDVLIVPQQVASQQRDQLRALIQGWLRAVDAFRADPEGSAARVAARQRLSPQEFLATFEGIALFGFAENQQFLAEGRMDAAVQQVERVMVERGFLSRHLDTSSFVDGAFVRRAP